MEKQTKKINKDKLLELAKGALLGLAHADGCFCDSAFAMPGTHVRHTDECEAALYVIEKIECLGVEK